MPSENISIWTQQEADQYHCFDYWLAQWIGQNFYKKKQLIDLGCGRATYLRYLHDIGFELLRGIEGTALSNFDYGNVRVADLSEPIIPDVTGNVICLEVGEHIFEPYLDKFLDNIKKHVSQDGKILLSWGVPGQEGVGHVSCRHNIWVINEMEKRGLKLNCEMSLSARSVIKEPTRWFRNTLMFFEK